MKQITLNWLTVFIIPAAVGFIARMIFKSKEKGHIVTVIFCCISVIFAAITVFGTNNGNEAPGLLTVASLCASITSLLTGAVICLINRKNNRKTKQ